MCLRGMLIAHARKRKQSTTDFYRYNWLFWSLHAQQDQASYCAFLLLYTISSSSVRSFRASVVASLWRSLPSRESVIMGPQHLHQLLFPSRYFLLCHIMHYLPTAYTCCCSWYCVRHASTRIIVPTTRHTLL